MNGYFIENDVCLTDCVFLCILSAAFGILWLDLDLWCKSQLYFLQSFSYTFYIYMYNILNLRVLSFGKALACEIALISPFEIKSAITKR